MSGSLASCTAPPPSPSPPFGTFLFTLGEAALTDRDHPEPAVHTGLTPRAAPSAGSDTRTMACVHDHRAAQAASLPSGSLCSTRSRLSPSLMPAPWKRSCDKAVLCTALSPSVVSDALQPHGLQPTGLPCPWDFPGKSPGVWCHCLLQCIKKQRHHFANKSLSSQSYGFSSRHVQM